MSETYTKSLLRRSVIEPYQPRSATDRLIDGLTPLMIFAMVCSVLFFLLDIRYVFTEVHDRNLRLVAFALIMGIVAVNRLINWEGMQEGFLYFAALAGVVVIYTLATTSIYGVGSFARGFLDRPGWAAVFNLAVVGFIWWVTHRLTKECCIDDNPMAGDIGILTGTLRKVRKAFEAAPPERADDEPYDPTEWKKPVQKPRPVPLASDRPLPKRHPGVSIFYFSVPVMLIFAAGLPVLRQGGPGMVMVGHVYVAAYTAAALFLLMLTSLGGLREYFRRRHIHLPAGLGPFWIGLGTLMIACVLFGATALPMPQLPGVAAVGEHETDFWTRGSTFRLSVAAPAVEVIQQSGIIDRIGTAVLIVLGLFVAFSALRLLGGMAARIARRRHRFPPFVVRFFDRVDRFLQRIVQIPSLPQQTRTPRVSRDIAISARYRNPMSDPAARDRTPQDLIAHAYEALCALAYDLGVPRKEDQTPYEFIDSFPPALDRLREEAVELTDLFVRASYSNRRLEPRVEDRLRKFWLSYERVRNRVVR